MENIKNKGLRVAGQHGAATTEERYGKEFLLQKIREKQGLDYLYRESDEFLSAALDETPPPCEIRLPPTMHDILGPGGIVAQNLTGYETREQQLQMAETVAEAIKSSEPALIEAGTGVGKSLAYLIPAIYSGKKTIVSTGDKALQDQIWRKDIPFLQCALPLPFNAAILKGRANYICLERWNEEIGDQVMFGASAEFAHVQMWIETTESGDLEELSFSLSPELASKVTSTADACLGRHCASFASCYAEKSKAAAESADIVIVNHTLLTLDASIRAKSDDMAKVIPDRDLVIIDEAHNLENAATLAFQTEVSANGIWRLVHDKQTEAAKLDPAKLAEIDDAAQGFFDSLARLNSTQSYALGEPPHGLRLQAENLALKLKDMAREMERNNPFAEDGGAKNEAFGKHTHRVKDYGETILNVLFPSEGSIVYVEKVIGKKRQLVYLRKCPISVADHLRGALFDKWPVICTSATLSTAGNFEYFRGRCGCDEANELIVGSPFDYQRNALIYMPANGALFDPTRYYQDGSPEYFDRMAEQIGWLLLASEGRAFCLFTSNKALNEIYDRIAYRLRWLVLKQGQAPRPELLKQFKEDGHAVLFATRSFFEGIDVQGEALSLVIIDKIPFGQPDDPIYQARCDEIVKRTGNKWAWFNQLALPNAIITYKQGFGRLIRTKLDFGVVALLDGRITTKNYGSSILRSLPQAAQTRSLEAVKTFFETREIVDPQQGQLL